MTSAQKAHSEEMSGRARRYLVSMGIRTVCLILAIFVLHGWLRLVGIAAALVLPWFAVVMANAGPVADEEQPEFIDPDRREISSGANTVITTGDDTRASAARGSSQPAAGHHGEPASETMAGHRPRTS